ncbi:hypothetical protein [Marinobacter sp. S6332]|uniref:hypothetical protein n=1 Tax=Marinobacter sp. S6332 TaxID=2926403 RepID=UPI001FF5F838|nr:hypothetical protein [Marinobacter sp. S6332]MCK0165386.1 hypothetical protein [Marinobacter sp. S6332]
MRLVSIATFIAIVYSDDETPPSVSTVRQWCPKIPGAFRDGRRWRIDLDYYFEIMNGRIRGMPEDDQELSFLKTLARQLK